MAITQSRLPIVEPCLTFFREGQGIIAEGVFDGRRFNADTVLAKHDETYMPKEVAETLKEQGVWQGQGEQQ